MNLPAPPITTSVQSINQSFSPQILERFNSKLADKILWIDDKFHKEFMRLIDNSSTNDAKQIIHIHNKKAGMACNFDYKSEYDILLELQTIVCSMTNPTKYLLELFQIKSTHLLPVGTYSWIAEDLDAILFFLNITPDTPLMGRAFKGGSELMLAFINFIQFHTIDSGWTDSFNGYIRYIPIEFASAINLEQHFQNLEGYKTWYLNQITPRKEFKWLEKCNETQLDSLIENLEKNNLRILKGVFHPVTTQDKISLIISSLNSVRHLEDIHQYSSSRPEECMVFQLPYKSQCELMYHGDWVVLKNFDKNLLNENLNLESYAGVGMPASLLPSDLLNTISTNGSITLDIHTGIQLYAIPSLIKTTLKGRNSYYKQFYDASRQKRHRDSQSPSKEECSVKILKKNMPILEKLAQAEGLSKDKYINKLIVEASKPK